jgi:hypothetical protein
MSTPPPAENPAMMRTGRLGYGVCAGAGRSSAGSDTAAPATLRNSRRFMIALALIVVP